MNQLALSDEILMGVEKPARYIGNEINAVKKNADEIAVRFCLCFPDVYEIGMSHMGIQILYDILNQRDDVWCERAYSPWLDLDKVMREKKIPLFALESQAPIRAFDFLGITLQYEMCYTNILQILELGQIPRYSLQRGEEDPIVIGGGPCVYNPEPLAEFFDIFYIGEGEVMLDALLDAYRESKTKGYCRRAFLELATTIPGLYVPMFYDATYFEDGTLADFKPNLSHAPKTIKKQVIPDLATAPYPLNPIVPFIKATQDRVVLEIQRGCIRGCRFCQAGMVYRPTRGRPVEQLKRFARDMLKNTGHEEISLSSLSSSDYPQLQALIYDLIDACKGKGINISLPSLRIDTFSLDVMSKVQDRRKSSLTFAPEAGSQRLRNVVNKGLTEEMILSGVGQAFAGGWTKVKLYFMLGLPTETDADMEEIAHLAEKIAKCYYEIPKEERIGKCQITISTSFFIPKPFTPFQWSPMFHNQEYIRRAQVVKNEVQAQLNRKSIKYNWHEADLTVLEGLMARGDRRVSKLIIAAYEKGCLFDSWSEYFQFDLWQEAMEETNIDLDFYTMRTREKEERFPWDFIDIGVDKSYLWQEWQQAQDTLLTPNCREQCSACGATCFGGGVCFES
ncbi:MAG: TIGR03960 family B12-binding radical SAM protein [Lachnospiraceae bacterium]|nr:TIGR03960 family B12-binding radical SAM protein [Lachnospiraceae bacterium]